LDWNEPLKLHYGQGSYYNFILGNPPFLGTAYQSEEQKAEMSIVCKDVPSSGMLDYVAAWYIKAADYMSKSENTASGFVSTNSITQGEQVSILWSELFNKYKCKINFAHRTFRWTNEAKGVAAVHVVIIGFSIREYLHKTIFSYSDINCDPKVETAKNINPYLVEGNDNFLPSRTNPLCKVPKMQSGSAARDGGHLILEDEEKAQILLLYPELQQYLRRFISGDDILNNVTRWCLWLKGADLRLIKNKKDIQARLDKVREFRLQSTRAGTKKMADFPYLFAEERQPRENFLIIPKVSSEKRKYIPIAYLTHDYIVSDKTFVLPQTTLFHFGILTSLMHNTWMRYTCGRMKSDYSYSNTIVYNNYPWPDQISAKQRKAVEEAAQAVLDARLEFPESSLADLYDPNTMPPVLVKAHQQLDKAVDHCYRPQPFTSEAKRIEFLFTLYEKYNLELLGARNV
jgi:hypothetical protein